MVTEAEIKKEQELIPGLGYVQAYNRINQRKKINARNDLKYSNRK